MNNKGFTLVEIISVIALLALVVIISVPAIGKTSENIKKKTLQTKIENIEQAAILYGQDHRENFTTDVTKVNDCLEKYCKYEDGSNIENCECYKDVITVNTLIDPNGDSKYDDKYLEPDDEETGNISNSVNEAESLNECEIQIYQKYGKIYAVYDTEYDTKIEKEKCFYIEN